jgi:hypothetical protein
LLRAIHRDESRWCAMLHRHIDALGGDPAWQLPIRGSAWPA